MNNEHLLRSPICHVHFAGFRSTTAELQAAGWDLSAQQEQWGRSVRLSMRHRATGFVAITDAVSMMGWHQAGTTPHLPIVFEVQAMSNDLRMVMVAVPEMRSLWAPIDAFPSCTAASYKEMNLRDVVPFKTINHNAEQIVVAPESVTEVLNLLLRCQEPAAAARRIRERTRDNIRRATDIQAQIVVEAS